MSWQVRNNHGGGYSCGKLVVRRSWQVRNNHGGGYSYRLCPASEPLTEECFQRHPLDVQGSLSVLQFSDGSRVSYKPVLVSEGTQPKGSMWARIPVAPTNLGPICIPGPNDDPAAPHSCDPKNNHPADEPCGCTPCPQVLHMRTNTQADVFPENKLTILRMRDVRHQAPTARDATTVGPLPSRHSPRTTGCRCRAWVRWWASWMW